MENRVLTAADSVVTISNTLREVAIKRGVNPERIVIITNGVEESFINDTTKSASFNEIEEQLSSKRGSTVVGYIGSLREMEGVDFTAKAVGSLVRKGKDVKFFCLGGEAGQEGLRQVCVDEGLAENSLVVGPVPHIEVPAFYDLIDIFVVSRPDFEVTRKVTPLKPFEAMGRGRAVIVSNLEALTEIVQDGVTGVVVDSNDVEGLSLAISELTDKSELRSKLGNEARLWIRNNRLWKDVIQDSRISYQIALKLN
jgi:glycosyltransferase involved in cell wall biosynthesis